MLAIIKTGGKQYLVSPGQKIKIEKIKGEEGQEIVLDKVLLLEKNKKIQIGKPLVTGAKVTAKIVKEGKAKKIIIFKYKAKKRYKVKKGHRQPFTLVEIKQILEK